MGIIIFILNILSSLYISINIENKSITRFILLFWLTLCGQVVLISYLLSIFPLLTPLNFLLLSILFSTVAYSLLRRKKKNQTPDFNLKAKIKELTTDKLMVVFVFGITVIVLYNFVVALLLPSLNWDGSSYHVPRIYHWLQNQQIGHYQTQEFRQNQYPINNSILLMWTYLVSRNYLFINLIQWFSYITAGVSIYLLGRLVKLTLHQAIFSTCLFFSLPMIVMQSTTVQNDLIVTSFMLCFIFFLLEYLFKEEEVSMIFSGIALGLGIGTKYTSVMLAPGIFIMLIPLLYQRRDRLWKFMGNIFLYCLLGIILFSSLNFVENYLDYKNPLGNKVESNIVISEGNPFSSSVRYFFQLLDFTGLQEPLASTIANKQLLIWNEIYEILDIKMGVYESNYLRVSTYWHYDSPHEDIAGYGIVGLLLLLASPFVFIKKNKFVNYLVLVSWLWLVIFLILFPHSPWRIRYLCLPMSIVSCASGVWYEENGKNIITNALLVLVVFLSIYIGNYTSFTSDRKDLSVLFTTTSRQDFYLDALPVEDQLPLKIIREIIKPNSKIVTYLSADSREFYYYNILNANEFIPDDYESSLIGNYNQGIVDADYYISNLGEGGNDKWKNIFDSKWSIMSKTFPIDDNPFIEVSENKGQQIANNLIQEILYEIDSLSKRQLEQIIEYSYTLNTTEKYSLIKNIYVPVEKNIFITKTTMPSNGIYSDHWTKNEFTIFFPTILLNDYPDYSMMIIEMNVSDRNKQMPIQVTSNGKELITREGDGYFQILINKEDIEDFEDIVPIDFKVNTFIPSEFYDDSIDNRELGWFINSIKYEIN